MCFQIITGWHTLEMCNYIIPQPNGIEEYAILVSRGLTPYFTKCIEIIISIQGSKWR